MERRISPRNQANSPVFSIRSERTRVGGERAPSAAQFTKKTTSASGGRLLFAFGALRVTELQASLPAEMCAITRKCDQCFNIKTARQRSNGVALFRRGRHRST